MGSWKILASKDINFIGYTNVRIVYSLSPSLKKVLSFFKVNHYTGEKQRVSFLADDDTIQNLLEFLHGEVKKEFEVKPHWIDNYLYDYSDDLRKRAVSILITKILGKTDSLNLQNQYTNNENLVIRTFKEIYPLLGFEKIIHIKTSFPDATCIKDGKEVKCEFEYRSVNFKYHGHDPTKCDYIICWIHDWKDSPIPVISVLDSLLEMIDVEFMFNGKPLNDSLRELIKRKEKQIQPLVPDFKSNGYTLPLREHVRARRDQSR